MRVIHGDSTVVAVALAGLMVAGIAEAQLVQPASRSSAQRLALTPGVILVKAQPGSSTSHPMTLSNLTDSKLAFSMKAFDVIVEGGKRIFVPAGETEGGIARSAIFEPPALELNPGESGQVKVTLTVPPEPKVRAVVAMFQTRTGISGKGSLIVTGSLGALITYRLSERSELHMGEPSVTPATESSNLKVSGQVANTGAEPVVTHGTLAILKRTGELVGRVAIESHRLLPGEAYTCTADFSHDLPPGLYRALISLEHEGGVLTRAIDFTLQ